MNEERIKDLEKQKQRDRLILMTGKAAVDSLAEKNRREQEYQEKL